MVTKKVINKIKIVHIIIAIAVIICTINYLNIMDKRTPMSVSKIHLGFNLPDSFKIEKYIDYWPVGLGDGETYIVFSYVEKDENYLIGNIINNGGVNTKVLPKPDHFMLYYGNKPNDFNGFYLNKISPRETKTILLDTDTNRGYIYYELN